MKRAVIIDNGVVVGATDTDTLKHPDGLKMVYSDGQNIGDLYNGRTFKTPKPTEEEILNEWIRELQGYDFLGVTRTIENIITSMSADQQGRVDSVTMDRYNAKLAVRLRKP